MNINEILTNNITTVVIVIIVLIVLSVIITFMLLKATEVKYNDLESQNAKLYEQVKVYTNNLAKLYEQDRYIDDEANDAVTQNIPAPDVDAINSMNNMSIPTAPVQQVQQPQQVQTVQQPVQQVQPQQQPVQQQNEPVATTAVSTPIVNTVPAPEQDAPK